VTAVQAKEIFIVVTEPLPAHLDGHWTLEKRMLTADGMWW
jgi:hypothetical protein